MPFCITKLIFVNTTHGPKRHDIVMHELFEFYVRGQHTRAKKSKLSKTNCINAC